jgi:hypothetical protein
MGDASSQPREATPRDLLFFRTPRLWTTWPFLPVVRHKGGGEPECGVLSLGVSTAAPCRATTKSILSASAK